jgi:cytochrome c5
MRRPVSWRASTRRLESAFALALSVAVSAPSGGTAPLIAAANARTTAPQPSTCASARPTALPPGPARELFVRVCTRCHAADLVIAKRHTPEEWDDLIAKMVDRGAMATDDEQQRIFEYLVRFYGNAISAPAPHRPQTSRK